MTMTVVSDETGRDLPSVSALLLEAARHAERLGKSEWATSAREAVRRAATVAYTSPPAPAASVGAEEIDKAILSFARTHGHSLALTRDVGPYEIATPSRGARQFADTILSLLSRAEGESDQTKPQKDGSR